MKKNCSFFRDKVTCLLQVIKFSIFFGKMKNYYDFLKKEIKKICAKYKMILKNTENPKFFTIYVHYSI